MKVYKLGVMVIDHDDVGAEGVKDVLESAHYPNRCIRPVVATLEEHDVGPWDDDHPLNDRKRWKAAFAATFQQSVANDAFIEKWIVRLDTWADLPPRQRTAASGQLLDLVTELNVGELENQLELAWGVIANAWQGDWTKAPQEWQEAAARWRDRWLAGIGKPSP